MIMSCDCIPTIASNDRYDRERKLVRYCRAWHLEPPTHQLLRLPLPGRGPHYRNWPL